MDGKQPVDSSEETLDGEFLEVFELQELISSNGVSSVYRARQRLLNREVAIKIIETDESAAARLRREARIVSSLNHPNIVKVFSFGKRDETRFYLAMEWIEGGTLANRLRAVSVLPPAFIRDLLPPILDALRHAHLKGIVHRDLKPSNILIKSDAEQTPIVADFGIARSIEATEGADTITEPGVVVGSPLYISPEQCTMAPVDQRADIYSIGAILCECLTGRPPYEGETVMEVMYKHLHEPKVTLEKRLLGSADPALGRVALRCLSRDPADRYPSVDDLIEAVSELPDPGGVSLEGSAAGRTTVGQKASWSVIMLLILCAVAGSVYFKTLPGTFDVRHRPRSERAITSVFDSVMSMPDSSERRTALEELMQRADAAKRYKVAAFCAAELMVAAEVKSQPLRMKRIASCFVRCVNKMEPDRDPHFLSLGDLTDSALGPYFAGDAQQARDCLDAVGRLFERWNIKGETKGKWHLKMLDLYLKTGKTAAADAEIKLARQYFNDGDLEYAVCLVKEAQMLALSKRKKEAALKLAEFRKMARLLTSDSVAFSVAECQMLAAGISFEVKDDYDFLGFLDDAERTLNGLVSKKTEQRVRGLIFLHTYKAALLARRADCRAADKAIAEARRLLPVVDQNLPAAQQKFKSARAFLEEVEGEIEYQRGDFNATRQKMLASLSTSQSISRWEHGDVQARAHWLLGLMDLRLAKKDDALGHFQVALPLTSSDSYLFVKRGAAEYMKLLKERGDTSKLAELQKRFAPDRAGGLEARRW